MKAAVKKGVAAALTSPAVVREVACSMKLAEVGFAIDEAQQARLVGILMLLAEHAEPLFGERLAFDILACAIHRRAHLKAMGQWQAVIDALASA
jgi:hypothetical protein